MSRQSFVPQAKILRVLTLMMSLYHRHYTPKEAGDFLGVTERSAYRYFDLIQSLGVEVDSIGSKHFIAQDDCPFCQKMIKAESQNALEAVRPIDNYIQLWQRATLTHNQGVAGSCPAGPTS